MKLYRCHSVVQPSPSFRQLEIPVFPECFRGFSEKNFSRCFFFTRPQSWTFSLNEFCNDRKRWKSEGARSDGGWGRTRQPIPTIFDKLSNTHEAANCLDETRRPSDSLFLIVFVQLLRLLQNNTSLNLSSQNSEQYFSDVIVLVKAHNTGSLSNPAEHGPSFYDGRLLGWLKLVHSTFAQSVQLQHFPENCLRPQFTY